MATVTGDRRYTPEDLLKMSDGERFELADGQLVETEMSLLASFVTARLIELLSAFVRPRELGGVFNSDASYQCFPRDRTRVRRPDASFISRARLRSEYLTGHVPIAPDLAVEVASPNDSFYDVQEKIEEYLQAGVKLIWVMNPDTRIVQIYRADRTVDHLDLGGEISGEDVIPGFRCQIADLFKLPPVGE